MASKNNPNSRKGEPQTKRMLDGQEVRPTLYAGSSIGQGNYMSGTVNDELVRDSNGKPVPLRGIGKLQVV